MVSVIKSAILILSVFSSLSFSFGHRFLLQDHDHQDMYLPLKGAAVTLGDDDVASNIGGGKIPEIHSLCQTCNCGGGGGGDDGGGDDDDSSSGNPLAGIPLLGDIIPDIRGALGIPNPEKPQPQEPPRTPQPRDPPRTPVVDSNKETSVCGCCGQRCGGTCGCNKGSNDGHEMLQVFEDAKNPLPPILEAARQDTIHIHD